eukprot:PhF_6_TR31781/c1_g1_i2/m.46803
MNNNVAVPKHPPRYPKVNHPIPEARFNAETEYTRWDVPFTTKVPTLLERTQRRRTNGYQTKDNNEFTFQHHDQQKKDDEDAETSEHLALSSVWFLQNNEYTYGPSGMTLTDDTAHIPPDRGGAVLVIRSKDLLFGRKPHCIVILKKSHSIA